MSRRWALAFGALALTSGVAVGTSGGAGVAALSPGGTLAQSFVGSVLLKVPSGASLVAGINTYTYTLPGLAGLGSWAVVPYLGAPGVVFVLHATSVGTTLTLRVIVNAPVTLTEDFLLGQTEVTYQQYLELLQWAYDRGHVTAPAASVQDAMGSTAELCLILT